MADIELVIKVSEEDFEIMKHNIAVNNPLCPLSQEEMVSKVAKGTPLPKGHGRLIDADALIKDDEVMEWISLDPIRTGKNLKMFSDLFIKKVNVMPTIIEADKTESEV